MGDMCTVTSPKGSSDITELLTSRLSIDTPSKISKPGKKQPPVPNTPPADSTGLKQFASVSSSSLPNLRAPTTQYLQDNSLDSVVQVLVWSSQPNSGLPWQMRPERQSSGSAFVVEGRRLVTNAHCVHHANVIRVKKRAGDRKFEAKVVQLGKDCDLALLEVTEDVFWEGLVPSRFGEFPVLQDTAFVVGYPTGSSNICVTAGVVSRIDIHRYSYTKMTSQLMAIQIDAAVNDGNSGGPAFNMESEVVGVAFESAKDSQNIGYIIPLTVVQHFLKDFDMNGKYSGICDKGFNWQTMENPSLKDYYGMKVEETGILVTHVFKTGCACNILTRGDVVCAIDGINISDAGTVPLPGGPVLFEYAVKNKFVGDKVELDVIRKAERIKVYYPLQNGKKNYLVPIFHRKTNPEYLVVGGLVFVSLSIPYLTDEFGDDWWEDAPQQLVHLVLDGIKHDMEEQVVVLARVLAADINEGYQDFADMRMKEFNGVKILNLAHLSVMVEKCTDKFYTLTTQYNNVIVLDREKAEKRLPEILDRHSIPDAKRIFEDSVKALGNIVEEGTSPLEGVQVTGDRGS